MNKKNIVIIAILIIAAVLVLKQSITLKGFPESEASAQEELSGKNEALLKIEGMTCGSCVEKIKAALSIPGKTEKVYVSLARENASVIFNPSKISTKELTDRVAKAGNYKATLVKLKDEKNLAGEAAKRKEFSANYTMAVNGKRVTNEEFNKKLFNTINIIKKQNKLPTLTEEQTLSLTGDLADEMITEMLINDVLEKEKIQVSDAEINQQIDSILKQYNMNMESLNASLKEDGRSVNDFRNDVGKNIMLEKFLNSKVFPKDTPENKKGDLFQAWLTEIEDAADIQIYNPEILQARDSGGPTKGCGGSCCSKS